MRVASLTNTVCSRVFFTGMSGQCYSHGGEVTSSRKRKRFWPMGLASSSSFIHMISDGVDAYHDRFMKLVVAFMFMSRRQCWFI